MPVRLPSQIFKEKLEEEPLAKSLDMRNRYECKKFDNHVVKRESFGFPYPTISILWLAEVVIETTLVFCFAST